MRSRPEIRTTLAPATVTAGQRLTVNVTLESRSETPFDGIDVTLEGVESRYKRTVYAGKTHRRTYHRRAPVSLVAKSPGGVLGVETRALTFAFDLPADAPPSYQSALTTIEYTLTVRVVIPWWPDAVQRYVIPVIRPAIALPAGAAAFTTQEGEHRGEAPVVELALASAVIVPGEIFDASVAVTGLGTRKVERVELSCVAVESANVSSSAGPTEVERHTWRVCDGPPVEGEAIRVRGSVPSQVVQSFSTPFITVSHALEAKVVVAWGSDLVLRAPVAVTAVLAPPMLTAPPLVGRARHRDVWLAARESLRLPGVTDALVDPDEATARFTVGAVRVTAREESHADLGPCVAVELEYPSLGLDLRVAERSWTDFGAKNSGLGQAFRRRFSAKIRDEAQLAAALDEHTQSALLLFDQVGMSDESVVALRKGGVYQLSGLQRVLSLAHLLAQRLDDAPRRAVPPPALAEHLPRWKRFAENQQARLRVGDLSIHDWVVRGLPLSIEHVFSAEIAGRSAIVARAPLRGQDDAHAQRLSASTGHAVTVREGVVSLALPLVTDPNVCVPIADRFALALNELLTGATGAYR